MRKTSPISRIRKTEKTPLHQEAERRIRRLIGQPDYQKGALLPNEVGLAQKLGISRHTLRVALGRLVNEGLLVRTAGLGTRVCRQPVRTDVNAWSSFTREMERRGMEVKNFEMKVCMRVPPDDVAEGLGLKPGVSALHLIRVRGWEGHAAMVAESWLHPRLGLTGEEDFTRPLYEIVQRSGGVRPTRSVEEISVSRASVLLAAKLGLGTGDPLLLRKRLVFDSTGEAIEFNLNSYRPDSYVLHLELEATAGK